MSAFILLFYSLDRISLVLNTPDIGVLIHRNAIVDRELITCIARIKRW